MLRLSRAAVLTEIDIMINNPGPALGQRRWTVKGVACAIDRHSYQGDAYGFHAEILHVRMPATGRLAWELLIVTEFWRRGDDTTMHSTKWLKLLAGKQTDVLKWISTYRGQSV